MNLCALVLLATVLVPSSNGGVLKTIAEKTYRKITGKTTTPSSAITFESDSFESGFSQEYLSNGAADAKTGSVVADQQETISVKMMESINGGYAFEVKDMLCSTRRMEGMMELWCNGYQCPPHKPKSVYFICSEKTKCAIKESTMMASCVFDGRAIISAPSRNGGCPPGESKTPTGCRVGF